jgi:hypothetical protein
MTDNAIAQGLDDGLVRRRAGVITGFGREPDLIRVKRGGLKTSELWHREFWEREHKSRERN